MSLQVVVENLAQLSKNPTCAHGPTILFSRLENGQRKHFFACSACRDKKNCKFFLWENQKQKFIKDKQHKVWANIAKKYTSEINHHNLYLTFNEVMNLPAFSRMYCYDCESFQLDKYKDKHKSHSFVDNLSDHTLKHPSDFLKPLENPKLEAQYLFSKSAVETIVDILRRQNLKNVVCIGAPRIHDHILNNHDDMSSILLDIDKRYHHFYGPMQFCWYNLFNHHFFLKNAQDIFHEFLQNNGGEDLVIVTDPPFGGRTEPLIATFKHINSVQKKLNKTNNDVPVFWIFPYFMEPQIVNSLPEFNMLDYKVAYDNHPLFSGGPKGRKQGSPVRIFTNLSPSLIQLPAEEGYKHCKICNRWVYEENKHCKKCGKCTSKDGRTYVHCDVCKRCVKPTWKHCETCEKCTLEEHACIKLDFNQECFNCNESGHKKLNCPKLNAPIKRKNISGKNNSNKKKKI